jgi:hypothetical protein
VPSSSSSLVSLPQERAFPPMAEAGVDVASPCLVVTWGLEVVRLFETVSGEKAKRPAQVHAWTAVVPLRGEHSHSSRFLGIGHGVGEEVHRQRNGREEAEEAAHWGLLALPSLGLRSHRVRHLRRVAHVHY